MIIWNPWHGCHKISEGCEHCYMYFLNRKRGIDTSRVYHTESFFLHKNIINILLGFFILNYSCYLCRRFAALGN